MPGDVTFLTKPGIASAQIAKAYEDAVPPGVVLMHAGVNRALRDGIAALGLNHVAGVLPQTSVWKEGEVPCRQNPSEAHHKLHRKPQTQDRHRLGEKPAAMQHAPGFIE